MNRGVFHGAPTCGMTTRTLLNMVFGASRGSKNESLGSMYQQMETIELSRVSRYVREESIDKLRVADDSNVRNDIGMFVKG